MKKIIEVVGAIMESTEGKIFCAKRPKNKTFGGLWEFPGGKIEEGESKEEALVREIKEELNLEIEVKGFFDVAEKEYEKFIVKLYCYLCEVKNIDELILREHQEFKWVSKEEIEELDWVLTDIPVVEKLKKS